ncbi:MAG: hypothetical protein ACU0DK_08435 [Pseudooceanicola sp.]
MENAEKLAYFFESADLGSVFEGWPAEIGLVMCLDEAGSCELLLHHRDEGADVLRKAAAVLGLPVGEFAVVPEKPGLPTRRVLFSDEQRLLSLVMAEDDLPEMAADYLLNHQYEQKRKARKAAERAEAPREVAGLSADRRWEPRFHVTDVRHKPVRKPKADMPGGYAPASEIRGDECRFAEGILTLGRRGIRLVIAPDLVTARTRSIRVAEVGFRDDFSRFVLPREAFGHWQVGDALVIDMGVELFPAGLQQRFALAPRRADITVTQHGVFVVPGAAIEPEPPEPVRKPTRLQGLAAARKRIFTPLRLALVALTGFGLMTGSVMRAVDFSDAPPPPRMVVIGQ